MGLFGKNRINKSLTFQCIEEKCRIPMTKRKFYPYSTYHEAHFRAYPRKPHGESCEYLKKVSKFSSVLKSDNRASIREAHNVFCLKSFKNAKNLIAYPDIAQRLSQICQTLRTMHIIKRPLNLRITQKMNARCAKT